MLDFCEISSDLISLKFIGKRTSDPTQDYNCVGWAFRRTDRFWWPDPWAPQWPVALVGNYLLGEFENLFKVWGWTVNGGRTYEAGLDKIALYVDAESVPTHLARMVVDDEYGAGTTGLWTSKLCADIDALHELDALCGDARYGTIHAIYSKPR